MAPYHAVRDLYRSDDGLPDVFDEVTLQDHLVELRDVSGKSTIVTFQFVESARRVRKCYNFRRKVLSGQSPLCKAVRI